MPISRKLNFVLEIQSDQVEFPLTFLFTLMIIERYIIVTMGIT